MTTGKYTRVGDVKGPLTIGGSDKKMAEDASFTYVPMFRVAGSLSDVETWLKEHHPDEATKALQTAFNTKNLKKAAVKKAYVKELEEWRVQKEERSKTRQDEKSINLLILVELLKRYQQQRKVDSSMSGKGSVKTLRDKLAEVVSAGKVMDVTSAQEGGKGISRVTLKSNSIKKRLSADSSDALHNVVYNPRADNFQQGVRHFMTEYGGFSDEQIDTVVSALADGSEVTIATTSTPVASSRTTSPLTKRFTSPLRRNKDPSVDDLLDGLNA